MSDHQLEHMTNNGNNVDPVGMVGGSLQVYGGEGGELIMGKEHLTDGNF